MQSGVFTNTSGCLQFLVMLKAANADARVAQICKLFSALSAGDCKISWLLA
jgi:hypothetical protein